MCDKQYAAQAKESHRFPLAHGSLPEVRLPSYFEVSDPSVSVGPGNTTREDKLGEGLQLALLLVSGSRSVRWSLENKLQARTWRFVHSCCG